MFPLLILSLLTAIAEEAPPPPMVELQLVLLEKGPSWTGEDSARLQELQTQHLAHLHSAWEAGGAELCGPSADPSGTIRGVCLYDAGGLDAARAIAEQDPMVQVGHLAVRVLPWWTGEGFVAFPKSTGAHPPEGPAPHGAPPEVGHPPPPGAVHGASGHGSHGPGHRGQGAPHGGGKHTAAGPHADHATVHHRFDDVEKWTRIFDNPERLEWQKPDAVVQVLALEKKMTVADIGAGTGFFNPYLAAAVGRKGRVIPVDVERSLVDHMVSRARAEGTPQVAPRLGRFEDPALLPGEVDRILMVDTYHHISDRRDYFRRLMPSLKPGGQMVIVDFKPGDLPVGPRAGHKLPADQVIAELKEAGWRLVSRPDVLPHQYVLVFEPEPE